MGVLATGNRLSGPPKVSRTIMKNKLSILELLQRAGSDLLMIANCGEQLFMIFL